jgi:hypothetical protein
MPLVVLFILEGGSLLLVELSDGVESVQVASYEGSFAKELGLVGHSVLLGECLCIENVLLLGDTLWAAREWLVLMEDAAQSTQWHNRQEISRHWRL